MTDLTDKQLRYAKWYLRHKNRIRNAFVLALILLDIILIAIVVFQTVLYFNLKEEHLKNMRELTENKIDFLALNQRFAPQSVVTDSLTVIRPDPKKSQYDFIITVFNPNSGWRVAIEYYFSVNESETSLQSGFINPGEKKYFFVLGAQMDSEISDVQFLISSISWRRVRSPQKDFLSILDQLTIEDVGLKYLQAENESMILPQIFFKAKNNSIYDFYETRFVIALERDLSLVGLNIFSVDSWRANEEKNITFVWPLIPRFAHIEIKPEINVFNPEIFISPLL